MADNQDIAFQKNPEALFTLCWEVTVCLYKFLRMLIDEKELAT